MKIELKKALAYAPFLLGYIFLGLFAIRVSSIIGRIKDAGGSIENSFFTGEGPWLVLFASIILFFVFEFMSLTRVAVKKATLIAAIGVFVLVFSGSLYTLLNCYGYLRGFEAAYSGAFVI